ncbi:hypothetical protein IC619_011385 [Hazenella sp. IB182353]|uniref:hypothetical protein n=1 Tax=Polycladospora coralii TaxID=2771432 RepID=UPI001747355D|nr:hypothetical protein [Polycladospora coralii]MBS7531097.1 hypothetical protein [Polycladospora coralii]
MKHTSGGIMHHTKLFIITCIMFSTVMMVPDSVSAAYYNTYTTVSSLGNAHGSYATQGFGVGSTYTYSVKVNGDDTAGVIYRTKMSDGTTTLMKNGTSIVNRYYADFLGHGNDMALSKINGEYYMFIVTMKKGSLSLVKLKYVGTTYYKVGNYTIKYNGADKAMSGVKIMSKDANNIHFLFKTKTKFYKGKLPLTANSGTINVDHAFNLNVKDARVNGSTISNIDSYATQGIGLHKDTLYFPMTYKNVSIVLVYRNISRASGTIKADDDLSFRITSKKYADLFEIEGVGIANGDKLWFNTNRRKQAGDTASDSVGYFNGFSLSSGGSAAPNGEWDPVGAPVEFKMQSPVRHSTGGDVGFKLLSGPEGYYTVWEDDPDNADDLVKKIYLKKGVTYNVKDINRFVDGTNKAAEFYLTKDHNTSTYAKVQVYD